MAQTNYPFEFSKFQTSGHLSLSFQRAATAMSRRQGSSAPESQRSSSRLTNNSSSSNSTADQRSSRKRPVEEVVIDEENETPNKETIDDMPVPDVARKYDVNSFVFHPNDKDVHKFEALTPAVQAQCVKAVCRLFVMKAARKEPISRETIRAVLNEIDADYKKHVAAVLKRVQYQLLKSLGYVVVAGDSILGMKKNGKSDDYYVTNNLSSPKLMKLLNQAKRFSHINQAGSTQRNASSSSSSSSQPRASSRRESSSRPNYNEDQLSENEDDAGGAAGGTGSGGTTIAFVGFLVLVCGTIYTAPQKRISCEDLLAHIRKVDPRFPTRLTSAKEGSSVCPVPELEEQFVSLIRRLVKEHYLVGKRPEGGDKGEENVVYSLGSRFFLDVSGS